MFNNDLDRCIGPEGCIYLENFKSFGEPGQYLPLARLTLLFGPNSAGKSSVFQALELLRDLVYCPSDDRPNRCFSALVHNGQFDKDIVIGLLHPGPPRPGKDHAQSQSYPYPCFHFGRRGASDAIELRMIEVRLGTEELFRISKNENGYRLVAFNRDCRILHDQNTSVMHVRNEQQPIDHLNGVLANTPLITENFPAKYKLNEIYTAKLPDSIVSIIEKHLELFSMWVSEPSYLFGGNFNHIPAIRRIPSRQEQLAFHMQSDRSSPDNELYQWESLISGANKEWNGVAMFHERVNRWLGKSGVNLPYSILARRNEHGTYIVLQDSRLPGVDLDLTDVGTGVSQVIPVVCACCDWSDKWVVIEQPELHLHPRAQCALADVFTAKLNDRPNEMQNSNNMFLLETHSEHFLLRLLRRVRETACGRLPHEHLRLTPEDISVVYVDQDEHSGCSIASRIQVTEDGDFDGSWPRGFFTERLDELL